MLILNILVNWAAIFVITGIIWSSGTYPGDLIVFLTSIVVTIVIVGVSFSPIGERLAVRANDGRTPTDTERGYIEPYLQEVISKTGMKQPNLYVSDSYEANAKAVGRNSVILNLGLINNATPEELCGVIAHELGHLHYRDTTRLDLIFVLGRIGKWLTRAMLFAAGIGAVMGRRIVFLAPILILSLILEWFYLITEKIITTGVLFVSRQQELRADRFAVQLGYGDGLASFLSKIKTFQKRDFKTHPSTSKRLSNIKSRL